MQQGYNYNIYVYAKNTSNIQFPISLIVLITEAMQFLLLTEKARTKAWRSSQIKISVMFSFDYCYYYIYYFSVLVFFLLICSKYIVVKVGEREDYSLKRIKACKIKIWIFLMLSFYYSLTIDIKIIKMIFLVPSWNIFGNSI